MLIEILAAVSAEAPKNQFGIVEVIKEGGAIAVATLVILGIMSFGSFYILFTKLFEQQKIIGQGKDVRQHFWRANNLKEGAAKLDKNSAYRQIVDDGIQAQEQHGRLTDPVEAHDWLHGSLARSESAINAKLATGLPFLATVGATAPFVGLFGTVVGIYRALIKIGQSGNASIDTVAGPVGEALIMTAIGLAVAVPAVLAYNWLQNRNKVIAQQLGTFSNDVLGYMASGGSVKPALASAPAAATKKPAPATTAGGVQTPPRTTTTTTTTTPTKK